MSIPKLLSTRTLQLFRWPATLRGFAVFASRPPGPPPTILPSDMPIEEETVPFYDPKYFLPVNPGDVLNNRYKILVKFILQGLDYLHSECQVIHTDLKEDNILLTFENPSVLEDFLEQQAENHMPRKIKDGRTIYLSHNDFGPLRSFGLVPKIVDFGLAQSGGHSQPCMHPIQVPVYRAPEVLLGTCWRYKADIWNLGVLIWNMMEDRDLFTHLYDSKGHYDARAHLAEMIALLGRPPKELIDRERSRHKVKWSHAVSNPQGKLSQTAREFYGGPFFYPDGEFMHNDLIPSDVRLEDTILSLEGEDKLLFLDFVRKMLQWLPEDRATAKELIEDPWLEYKST